MILNILIFNIKIAYYHYSKFQGFLIVHFKIKLCEENGYCEPKRERSWRSVWGSGHDDDGDDGGGNDDVDGVCGGGGGEVVCGGVDRVPISKWVGEPD